MRSHASWHVFMTCGPTNFMIACFWVSLIFSLRLLLCCCQKRYMDEPMTCSSLWIPNLGNQPIVISLQWIVWIMIRFADGNSEIMYRFKHEGKLYLTRIKSIICILKTCKEAHGKKNDGIVSTWWGDLGDLGSWPALNRFGWKSVKAYIELLFWIYLEGLQHFHANSSLLSSVGAPHPQHLHLQKWMAKTCCQDPLAITHCWMVPVPLNCCCHFQT